MKRIYLQQNIIPRVRGVFPRGIYSIPYIDDLYPIPSDAGVCGVANHGGRYNLFDDTTTALDQIGDETRALESDRCISSTTNGGAVILDTSLTLIKWAASFRMSNYVLGTYSRIVGGYYTKSISISTNNIFYFLDSNINYYYFDGSGNTQNSTLTTNTFDCLMYSDGINIYLYVNGEYYGYITPQSATLFVSKLINGYYTIAHNPAADNYDYRIWDLTNRTAQEINDYFNVNGCLFHVDNMAEDSNFEYHRYLMNEKEGSVCFDSGSVANKIHGTYFYDDVNVPVDNLHNVTIYPEILKNRSNLEGWNKAACFNGVNSKIDLGYITVPNEVFFIEFWTQFNNNVKTPFSIGFYDDDEIVFYKATSEIRLQVSINGSAAFNIYAQLHALDNIGKVKITLNGDNRIYVNGVDVTTGYGSGGDRDTTFSFSQPEKLILGQRENGTIVFDSLIAGFNFNNTLLAPLNGSTTGTPTNIDFNKIVIPNDAANTGFDIFGRESLYKGSAKYNLGIEKGKVAVGDGTGYIEFVEVPINIGDSVSITLSDMGSTHYLFGRSIGAGNGIGITSNDLFIFDAENGGVSNYYTVTDKTIKHKYTLIRTGVNTSDLYIDDIFAVSFNRAVRNVGNILSRGNSSSNSIAATLYEFKINDTHYYYLNGHAINSVDGVAATNNGVTFVDSDVTTQATIDSLSKNVIRRDYGAENIADYDMQGVDTSSWINTNLLSISKEETINYNGELRKVLRLNDPSDWGGVRNTSLLTIGVQYKAIVWIRGDVPALASLSHNGGTGYGTIPYTIEWSKHEIVFTATTYYFGISKFNSAGNYVEVGYLSVTEAYPETQYIIDPQFTPLPLDLLLKGKGYKQVGNIDFNPLQLESYISYGENLVDLDFTNWNVIGAPLSINTNSFEISTPTDGLRKSLSIEVGKTYRVISKGITDGFVNFQGYGGSSPIKATVNGSFDIEYIYTANADDSNGIMLRFTTGSVVGNNIQVDVLRIQEVITHTEGSENLVVNGGGKGTTDWIDTDGDGLADNFSSYALDFLTGTASIHSGQRVTMDSMSDYWKINLIKVGQNYDVGTKLVIRCKFKTNYTGTLNYRGEGTSGTTKSFNVVPDTIYDEIFTTEILKVSSSWQAAFVIGSGSNLIGNWFEILEWEIYEQIEPVQVGELSHSFFNQLAFENNTFGLIPQFTQDIVPYINWNDIYSMSPELFNLLCEHPEYILEEYRGMWYSFKDTITDSVFYPNQRTLEQNNKIITKGGCPNYNI